MPTNGKKEPLKEKEGTSLLCDNCSEEFILSASDFTSREKTLKKEVVRQHGIICPHCSSFFHSYFETEKLGDWQVRMERFKRKQKEKPLLYQRKFQEYCTIYYTEQLRIENLWPY